MEQRDFLKKDELRTPKEEIDVRLVLEQYHAAMTEISVLREENTELKEQLAKLKKYVYGQKSEKSEVEGAEQIPMFDEAETNWRNILIILEIAMNAYGTP